MSNKISLFVSLLYFKINLKRALSTENICINVFSFFYPKLMAQ